MDVVSFPGLGIEINLPKVAFSIFGIDIYFYAICIVLGISIALLLCKISNDDFGNNYDMVIEIAIGAILFGYIGARIYYVIFNIDKYKNLLQILNIRDGGLGIYGGLIGAGLYVFYKCKKRNIDFLNICDYVVPFIAIAQSIGRWGNFFNKEAYGYKTSNFIRMGIYNKNMQYIEVHPTFLYESICTFLIYIFLRKLQKNRKFNGQILYTYIIFYSFIRMFIETLRVDSLMFRTFRISQILSVVFFVYFTYLLLKNNKNYSAKKKYVELSQSKNG